ncbi:unnamed protein product [Polarella glacialis]|uniref:Transmembrane protein n=1 Tax=Polarella glacialis TaxID=89957 RepID=A0A813JZA6_POLGL|nr:unnamed protein product [Polarella glacialis]
MDSISVGNRTCLGFQYFIGVAAFWMFASFSIFCALGCMPVLFAYLRGGNCFDDNLDTGTGLESHHQRFAIPNFGFSTFCTRDAYDCRHASAGASSLRGALGGAEFLAEIGTLQQRPEGFDFDEAARIFHCNRCQCVSMTNRKDIRPREEGRQRLAQAELEFRREPTQQLGYIRYYEQDPEKGCSEEQEANVKVKCRTVRLSDIRTFLRQSVMGDPKMTIGMRFLVDLVQGQPVHSSCPAALAVAYAALADALQCHWHVPRSLQTQKLVDVAIEHAQRGAIQAFGKGGLSAMLWSRWPLLSFLARLQPPLRGSPSLDPESTLVSWSSREADEQGGFIVRLNWAEHFATEVFSGLEGVELKVDMECADIFIYRSKVPINFGGVLIFVDGERNPEDSLQQDLLRQYPASIVVGPMPAGGFAHHLAVPYVSTSYAARLASTPIDLGGTAEAN